jgi:hypothetical protein
MLEALDSVAGKGRRCEAAITAAREYLAAPEQDPIEWTLVSEQMPPPCKKVLAYYKNSLRNSRRIVAKWVPAKTVESGVESDMGEYDDATDTYYDPEGWYECIDNWCEYTAVKVCDVEITHWMPLPDAPQVIGKD